MSEMPYKSWQCRTCGYIYDEEKGDPDEGLAPGLRDGQPRTLDEVARCYGITRERIRQIEARGLLKLRQPMRSQRLEGFSE